MFDPESNDNEKDCINCPKCKSTQFTANKKGFSLGNAITGDLLVGPVRLLGGVIGSNDIVITCLKCGHKWKPGNIRKLVRSYTQERVH